ncbi:CASP-like protein 1B2 [Tasmannia lanceolata]|uniref:CASP-like protein 1B2 n=1 Tax=Tasmannia lanceolata TaxID=3420 RepID=UPI0040639F6C
MALENGEKLEVGSCPIPKAKAELPSWVLVVLRLLALFATVSATLVMALNKQSITMVVALVGSTPITGTLTAKFQHTPAFVFFVTANAIASFHNLLMLVLGLVRKKFDFKGLELLATLTDMMMVALVSAAAAAASAMAELGKNGNSHAKWNKICDNFGSYCDHGAGALIASFLGVALLMSLTALSITTLYKNQAIQK